MLVSGRVAFIPPPLPVVSFFDLPPCLILVPRCGPWRGHVGDRWTSSFLGKVSLDSGGTEARILVRNEFSFCWEIFVVLNLSVMFFCWICWSVFPWTKYCIRVFEIHGGKGFRPNYMYIYIFVLFLCFIIHAVQWIDHIDIFPETLTYIKNS